MWRIFIQHDLYKPVKIDQIYIESLPQSLNVILIFLYLFSFQKSKPNLMQMEIPSLSQTRLSTKKLSQRIRIDRQGHPILKGYKLHSVTFIDNVLSGSNIHKIHIVDSWKHHNINEFQYKSNSKCCQIS